MSSQKYPIPFTELEMTQLHNVAALVLNDPSYFDSLFRGPERAALVRAKDKLAKVLYTLNAKA